MPANLDNAKLDRVRCATVVLPEGADWVRETEKVRDADNGGPFANELPLINS